MFIFRIKIAVSILCCCASLSQLAAQDRFELSLVTKAKSRRVPEKTIKIFKTDSEIEVDGILDEEAWLTAEKATGFHQQFPNDDTGASARTEARLTYDENNLYVGITCYDDVEGKYIVESLRRDFNERNNDYIMLVLDPFDDLTNGYAFAITPLGVQLEGLLTGGGGGFRPISSSWDNIWYSKTRKNEEGWVAEIKIPFKSIRYDDNITNWNIQFVRNDLSRNERSTWTTVRRQYQPTSLSYSGGLKWDASPPEAGSNISFIPYVSGSASQDFSVNKNITWEGKAGFDGKVALSSSLNLDLTVNPDFSTVEVDQQQTNIRRFELFFPERRQFFLENSDLFSEFGFRRSQVFFSRRIGLASPLLFGARLSGQIGSGLRIGLLNAQTGHQVEPEDDDIPAYNFTVATFRKQVFGRSSINGIFANKQALNFGKDEKNGFEFGNRNKYNRVYGIQYNLLSANDKWNGDFYFFNSNDPVHSTNHWAHGTSLRYNTRRFFAFWTHEFIGENFVAEMGFFPRTGYFNFGPFFRYNFYPESKTINRHGPGFRSRYYLDQDWDMTDRETSLSYRIDFLNSSQLELEVQETYIKLFADFDPTRSDDLSVVPLPDGSEYNWQGFNVSYESDSRKDFSFDVEAGYGGFYNGKGLDISGRVRYRIRPLFNLAFSYTFNKIDLPDPYPDGSFWLIGPRIDLTFTDKIYWTNFIQYNQQTNNININSRFQWRFAPVSDLFLVYTENYLPNGLKTKNRGVILKISYWINI
jgi:hypothetical protein